MDDLQLQLPIECLQQILETIIKRDPREARTSLNALLRVNRYIGQVTLPYIYRQPFLSEYCTAFVVRGLRELVRTLLGDILLCGEKVPKNLIEEFQLDSSRYTNTDVKSIHPTMKWLNYIGHLRYLDFDIRRFTTSILKDDHQFSQDEKDYIEGDEFWSQCPVSNDSMVLDTTITNNMDSDELEERLDQRKKELAWYFWRMGLYRDTLWTLATPVLDQLEGLSFPLSDISRWTGVVGRLGRLETLEFILDEIPSNIFFIDPVKFDEGSKLCKDEAMQALVLFVSEHTRLFKGRLKAVNTKSQQYQSQSRLSTPTTDESTHLSNRRGLDAAVGASRDDGFGKVWIYDCNSSTDEADDIAFAFSDTLKDLHISATSADIQDSPLPRTIEIGRGWVDMLVLTELRIAAYNLRLLIDQMLLSHCPNLTTVHLYDVSGYYPYFAGRAGEGYRVGAEWLAGFDVSSSDAFFCE
ncbi:hypothetical protein F5H01DRAFT_411196 [Linnemannia elongata]|nr:hypothetical protein F5H01DRAFT_411196 [Linnemannia elongata]